MWPIPRRSDAYLVIGLHNDLITFSHFIGGEKNKKSCPLLQSFHRVESNNTIFKNGVIYNPSALRICIQEFIGLHKLHDANMLFLISGMEEYEKIITVGNAFPHESEIYSHSAKYHLRNHMYLFSQDAGFVFYTHAIKKALLCQYQVFAIGLKLNLIQVVFQNAAFIYLYQFLKGNGFRHSQLSHDLEKNNYSFNKIVCIDDTKPFFEKSTLIGMQENYESANASLGALMINL